MAIFPLFKRPEFFSVEEKQRILEAIRLAEQKTSGEIRVFVETRCKFVDPLDRAAEIFWKLKMDQTKDRNAVLVYIAWRDRQFAVVADEGIHQKVGQEFWEKEVKAMREEFSQQHYVDALIQVIRDIGDALHAHFPYERTTDKNELPDDIVFGG